MTSETARELSLLIISLIILALVATSCDTGPDHRGIEVNEDIIAVYNQDKAMLLFEAMVEDAFGVRLDNVWQDTTVWWADTSCQGRDGYGIQWGRGCVAGIMWSCSEMYVALSNADPERTCGSALIHEFGHCLSGHILGGQLDGEHAGPIWDVVAEAGHIACARGW